MTNGENSTTQQDLGACQGRACSAGVLNQAIKLVQDARVQLLLSSLQARAGPDKPQAGPDTSPAGPESLEQAQAGPESPRTGQAADTLQDMELLDDGENELLASAAAWSADLLASATARNSKACSDVLLAKQAVNSYLDFPFDDGVHPEAAEDDDEQQQQQQEEDLALEHQQQQQQGDSVLEGGMPSVLTDLGQLALQPPVPLDAFVDPELWCIRQKQLLEAGCKCDRLGCRAKPPEPEQVGPAAEGLG